MAIRAAAYLALLGGEGLRRLAETVWYNSHYLAARLSEIPGVEAPLLDSEFIADFTTRLPTSFTEARKRLLAKGYAAGIPLEGHTTWLTRNDGLLTATEVHEERHIDGLVEALAEVLGVQ